MSFFHEVSQIHQTLTSQLQKLFSQNKFSLTKLLNTFFFKLFLIAILFLSANPANANPAKYSNTTIISNLGDTLRLKGVLMFSQFLKRDLQGGMEKSAILSLPKPIWPMITSFAVVTSPGSDAAIAIGHPASEIIIPRGGNDVLIGVDPSAVQPGKAEIDLLVGDLGKDRFILGDWRNIYYEGSGSRDFASIIDFNPYEDTIQLHGKLNDYQLVEFSQLHLRSQGTAIFSREKNPDIIAILPDATNLNLSKDYFKFVGNVPPKGPVLPLIKQLGTTGTDYAFAITNDNTGNVYITGGATGYLQRDSFGGEDAWVAKYDGNGHQQWIKQFGSSVEERSNDVATDRFGNVYLVGYTFGSLGKPITGVERDAWVAKYDSNGNRLWIKQFGTFTLDKGWSITVDNNSNIYLTGYTLGDLAAPNAGNTDTWVGKFDTNGNQKWIKQFGTSSFEDSFGIAIDKDSNIYAVGDIFDTPNYNTYDAKIIKYDKNGNQEWIRRFGTSNLDWLWSVVTDSSGNVYATGYTLGDSEGTNAGSYDSWLVKFDSNGIQQWVRQFGTAGDDSARGIAIDESNNLYLTGSTDGNLGGANAGSFDAWVAKYDNQGNQLWIKQFGTPDYENSHDVTVDNAGNVYVTGLTEGSLGSTNIGSYDTWVAKLSSTDGNLLSFN